MARNAKILFLSIFVTWTIAKFGESCSCQWQITPEQIIEDRDYAIKATILSEQLNVTNPTTKDDVYYKVRIDAIFKGLKRLATIEKLEDDDETWKIRMLTSRFDYMCGIGLASGYQYLITGDIYHNQSHTSGCDLVASWKYLTINGKEIIEILPTEMLLPNIDELRPLEKSRRSAANTLDQFYGSPLCFFTFNGLCVILGYTLSLL